METVKKGHSHQANKQSTKDCPKQNLVASNIKTTKVEEIENFVKRFYTKYGKIMSRLAHE